MSTNTELVPYEAPTTPAPSFLLPLGDIAGAKHAISQYEKLKAAIIQPSDIQHIQGRDFLKKTFWRRVAFCFGLSLELVREERLLLDDGVTAGKLAYRVTYRAVAPNGRSMDGDGMMVYGEKGQTVEHNIRAIAHTRAKNRAISDLVGGGEVSAEEMGDDAAYEATEARSGTSAARRPQQQFTLADCGAYALKHDVPAERFNEAQKRYANRPDDLMKAMMAYVKKQQTEAEQDMTVLPVGARGN